MDTDHRTLWAHIPSPFGPPPESPRVRPPTDSSGAAQGLGYNRNTITSAAAQLEETCARLLQERTPSGEDNVDAPIDFELWWDVVLRSAREVAPQLPETRSRRPRGKQKESWWSKEGSAARTRRPVASTKLELARRCDPRPGVLRPLLDDLERARKEERRQIRRDKRRGTDMFNHRVRAMAIDKASASKFWKTVLGEA